MGNQVEQCNKLLRVLKKLIQETGEDPLSQRIEILCETKKNSHSPISLITEVDLEALALSQINWIIGLTWVFKKRKNLRKRLLPFDTKQFDIYEPFGRRIDTELELWTTCLDFIDDFKRPDLSFFRTPLDGWFATTQERMLKTIPNRTKEAQLILLKEEVRQLESGINPHDPEKGEKELYNLIHLANTIKNPQKSDNNDLKKKRKAFRDLAWTPYINAHKEWYRRYATSKEVKAVCIEDDQLKYYLNGRQKRLVSPPLREDFRFRKKK